MTDFFGQPIPVLFGSNSTNREIYEFVWMKVRFSLNKQMKRSELWWTKSPAESAAEDTKEYKTPFVLKMVERTGKHCAICHWTEKCFGCMIDPASTEFAEKLYLKKNFYIAIDWNCDFIQSHYEKTCWDPQDHQSVKQV